MSYSLITGVDIGHYSIKAVVIKPVKGRLTLVSVRELAVEAIIFSDNHLLNHQEIVKKLKQLRKALPLFMRSVAFAIPDDCVISKLLQIDKALSAQEKEYAIIEAFSHQSAYQVEELYLDYALLALAPASLTQAVQVYASKRSVVDNYATAYHQAGFTPLLCDSHQHALVRLWQAMAKKTQQDNWLLLDIATTRATLVYDHAEQAPWCREFAFDAALGQQVEPLVEVVMQHVLRQWQLMSSVEREAIGGIWLTGSEFAALTLSDALAAQLGLKCCLFDPLSLFEHQCVQPASHGYDCALAAGLALLGSDWQEKRDVA
ncbi:type IV pilus biogenesis protein PilM [Vibrio ponticus]|nr:type IV pilus biogenesis protein PilM [Vibrio ponticus]